MGRTAGVPAAPLASRDTKDQGRLGPWAPGTAVAAAVLEEPGVGGAPGAPGAPGTPGTLGARAARVA